MNIWFCNVNTNGGELVGSLKTWPWKLDAYHLRACSTSQPEASFLACVPLALSYKPPPCSSHRHVQRHNNNTASPFRYSWHTRSRQLLPAGILSIGIPLITCKIYNLDLNMTIEIQIFHTSRVSYSRTSNWKMQFTLQCLIIRIAK